MGIRTKNLKKIYKKRTVVNNVSIEVKEGEVVGLLGPNGAGKTTTFYMVVGIVNPDGGNIYFDDEDITELPIYIRAKKGISYLPQESSIFRKMTVYDNIYASLEINFRDKSYIRDRVEELISDFNLTKVKDSMGFSLSGGERRRVEIARCLATNPKIILLDEPFAGIDPISVVDIQKMIHKLKNMGIGVLITDHNVRETLKITERAYILTDGEVLAEGEPELIVENPEVIRRYLGEDFSL
ncbi:LPS export ABC transporter ATP-binding protein [Calditerrivibrio nitroreducens]|uniref:Lipopolysaccharide export system ATP-binding protein LptB n=1 Tax=Calditerrivibrio nitroreducens (strain DSM 19672 / NBRC 101217 / Yu37-1) TaxID=768670 RepID=E4TK63_CALNY|nr:LPS export ABC transporter ATP-binding protein [Calditerrivibrio nitroreducens]ADR19339.1 ABC transporter related protein [Calditerrivibrio nitroreducens DSM 19672]